MRVLVVGGAGFIGSHLVGRLLREGHFVRVLDRSPPELHPDWVRTGQVQYVLGEFVDQFAVSAVVEGIDLAFHLASTTIPATSNVDMAFDVQSNMIGTLNFLKSAVAAGIGRVIFVSSGGTVYGKPVAVPISESAPTEPICSYGITKLAVEKYLGLFELLHGLDFVVFRLSNPFGEGQRPGAQGAIAAFMHRALRGEPIEIWGDGSVVRDYLYIGNVIDAFVKGMDYAGTSRIFNLGSGAGHSLNQVLELLDGLAGRRISRKYSPSRAIDVPSNILDIERIRTAMDWTPAVGFEDGLARTWAWYRRTWERERST